ncbi:MAG: hypothetical protein ACK56C_05185 [Alphaproteobacteria bacterium]
MGLAALAKRLPEGGDLADLVLSLATDKRPHPTAADLNCAIVGSAAVEHALRTAITQHLDENLTPTDLDAIFVGESTPGTLSTFDARINMAFALGVIDATVRAELKVLKLIRNTFAHAVMPVSFDDDALVANLAQIRRAARPPLGSEARNEMRPIFRYIIICALFCIDFRDYRSPHFRGFLGRSVNLYANALLGKSPSTDPAPIQTEDRGE